MNAKELIKQVMQKRAWYKGTNINRSQAYQLKQYAKENRLSYEKSSEILTQLGYKKIKEEEWEAPSP